MSCKCGVRRQPYGPDARAPIIILPDAVHTVEWCGPFLQVTPLLIPGTGWVVSVETVHGTRLVHLEPSA